MDLFDLTDILFTTLVAEFKLERYSIQLNSLSRNNFSQPQYPLLAGHTPSFYKQRPPAIFGCSTRHRFHLLPDISSNIEHTFLSTALQILRIKLCYCSSQAGTPKWPPTMCSSEIGIFQSTCHRITYPHAQGYLSGFLKICYATLSC